MARYKTVNGIRLIAPVDEKTRKSIERSGDLVAQVKKAETLGLLDKKHYEKLIKAYKMFVLLSYAICYVGLCRLSTLLL